MKSAGNKPTVAERLYPEYRAGGFSREDNSIIFYNRVQGLVGPESRVLDFGAGSNIWARSKDFLRPRLMRLQGHCGSIVGVDPDPLVLKNPWLDEAYHINPGEPLPFEDSSFDVIVSFAVLEHIDDPAHVASELKRVLKPGGWFCAWTPNKWGYVGIGARLVPNRYHAKMLASVAKNDNDLREDEDVYPVRYRMNTFAALKKWFPDSDFIHCSHTYNGPPSYHGERYWLARLIQIFEFVTPKFMNRYLHIIIQKR